ncbi:Catabolite control protein A [Paenibacillus konkukensis]|uniref:Catabolite control protein A n=1 Tax=Paenibacillus konkukensis TaxID=2020716 RepID=A0ABY4RXF7_9BACL|nr:LacI family DNA-binding transcriptional regulator [Paenibacillus konkukensis]UQZ86107.1 Catabolite control protein A [Paenibacillus konkukensis]
MGVTIKEIAVICGVSPGTVDRALNDRPGISEKTKAKIIEVARQLNYQPDYMARSLAKGRTMTIGVVLFDLYNRSFAQLMNSIEAECRRQGYFVDLVLTNKDPDNEKKCIEHLLHRKVDGIIIFAINYGEAFDHYLKSLNVPVVTVCNRVSGDWSYIGIDDRKAMKEAVQYICGKGYERFVYVCPPLSYRGKTNIFTQEERFAGCLEGLKECGIHEPPVIVTDKDYVGAIGRMSFGDGEPRTAIVCSCDIYALEVMNHLKGRGLRIPEDVGLMGFDNIDVLKYVTPALTTVEYDVEQFGLQAVRCAVEQIEQGSAAPVPLLPYRIIAGASI